MFRHFFYGDGAVRRAAAPLCLYDSQRYASRAHPLRALAHRFPAPGRRPHRPVLLGLRAPSPGRIRAAHRRHRRRTLHARGRAGHPRQHGLAGHAARRGPVLPDEAHGPLRRGAGRHARGRHGLPLLLLARGGGRHARSRPRQGPEAALRRHLAPRARQDPAAGAGRPQARDPLPQPDRRRHQLERHGQGPDQLRQRRARRPDHRAPGRHAHLQFLRGGRRLGHGHHPCAARRRPRQQHAAPDQHPARAGRHPARIRPCPDDSRAGRRKAVQAARRGQCHGIRRPGLPARSHGQLPGPAGLEPRRR
ncbi:Uncharacterised protein [Bordetella pertussis]|nr:Uncharacterised protein [Bordetella pertussis]CFM22096.1 Uncharacterised protein [Bordetella pertussis]CFN63129.1 Uncharacterised protein [Bordetella pertussis]CFN99499.1 Uncharacterised protein [Bordetella pertussis]CFO06339.1 Uncharacterised protein [Bordetella pertussis]